MAVVGQPVPEVHELWWCPDVDLESLEDGLHRIPLESERPLHALRVDGAGTSPFVDGDVAHGVPAQRSDQMAGEQVLGYECSELLPGSTSKSQLGLVHQLPLTPSDRFRACSLPWVGNRCAPGGFGADRTQDEMHSRSARGSQLALRRDPGGSAGPWSIRALWSHTRGRAPAARPIRAPWSRSPMVKSQRMHREAPDWTGRSPGWGAARARRWLPLPLRRRRSPAPGPCRRRTRDGPPRRAGRRAWLAPAARRPELRQVSPRSLPGRWPEHGHGTPAVPSDVGSAG